MIGKGMMLLALLLPGVAAAGELSDLLMAPGVFDAVPAGQVVAYSEARSVPSGEKTTVTDVAGVLRLEAADGADGRALRLVEVQGGVTKPVGSFPTGVANPLLLYFLETTVRVMAEATGGSPYYIRNRIREALVASDLGMVEGKAHEVVLTPFAADPNWAKMGDFGDLAVRLRFDPAAPERILELSADTTAADDGYHERLQLIARE